MDSELITLIKEMATDDVIKPGYNSDNSVKAKAYRKARNLTNPAYIQQLFEYVENDKNSLNRKNAYYILGHLLKTTADSFMTQKLVNSLIAERKKEVLEVILRGLSELTLFEPIIVQPILDLVESSDWRIRQSAIMALSKTNQEAVKNKLRNIIRDFQTRKDKLDVVYATAVIGQIGDTSDATMLQELLSSKVKDIRDSAQFAIQSIQDKKAT